MLRFLRLELAFIVALLLARECQCHFIHIPLDLNFESHRDASQNASDYGATSLSTSTSSTTSSASTMSSSTLTSGVGASNSETDSTGGVSSSGFIEGNGMGTWEMFVQNSGVSAMHMQIMPNNKAIVYDAASLGPSNISLPPDNCRTNIPAPEGPVTDCSAHGVKVDTITGEVKVLKVTSDIWCSSGALNSDGVLVSTGGFADGIRSLRYIGDCDTCDFFEPPIKLADERWYGTHVQLASGDFVVLGGRRAFNYEFVVPENKPNPKPGRNNLTFLLNTTDLYENNLYPLVHLAPSGNLFVLANYKSIMLDPFKNEIIREYPDLPGGARNYPGSASTAILPLKLKSGQKDANDIEVLVCGGGDPNAFGRAEKDSIFLPSLDSCGRIKFMQDNANWDMETMPSKRVMGDMLVLPNGHILILNGAQAGASGWYDANMPNFTPVLYRPDNPKGERFRNLEPSNIARMYHSSSALLVSGKILVAGSNPNQNYVFVATGKSEFLTELRMEKFSPPYMASELDPYRPKLDLNQVPKNATYGQSSVVGFTLDQAGIKIDDLAVALYKPPFTTHGYSMNQRMLVLALSNLSPGPTGQWSVTAEMPNGPHLAPPGYYYLFLTYRGVPGEASWIRLMP